MTARRAEHPRRSCSSAPPMPVIGNSRAGCHVSSTIAIEAHPSLDYELIEELYDGVERPAGCAFQRTLGSAFYTRRARTNAELLSRRARHRPIPVGAYPT